MIAWLVLGAGLVTLAAGVGLAEKEGGRPLMLSNWLTLGGTVLIAVGTFLVGFLQ
jgi:hypothetical protein